MYFKGEDFVYTFNGENKTKEEIEKLIDYDTTVSIDGLNINYFSPKKENEREIKFKTEELRNHILNNNTIDEEFTDIIRLITADSEEELIVLLNELCDSNKIKKESAPKKDKIQEILKEVDEHQAKKGGILRGVEFPFDTTESYLDRSRKPIEDWNRKEFYITPPSKENLDIMCNSFEQRVKNDSDKCGIVNNPLKEKFTEAGQKYNKLKAPLDIIQTKQFPKALQLLALSTAYGHHKYKDTDLDFLNFKRVEGGSQTYLDAQSRHATDRNNLDSESGLHHFIHSIWNGIAALEIWAEENKINIEEYSKNYLKSLVDKK